MRYKYIFLGKAQEEYEQSIKWYAQSSLQASMNFVLAVEFALNLICEHPLRWRNTYKNYYELGLKKFPFVLIYVIEPEDNLVVITAVYHAKRNPRRRYRKP